jgi:hypothetical protein
LTEDDGGRRRPKGLRPELVFAALTDDELTELLLTADSEDTRDIILEEIERRRSIFR